MKDIEQFIALVAQMRQAQKSYFNNRTPKNLQRAKNLEQDVDKMLKTVNQLF
jgi:hypothetical protein